MDVTRGLPAWEYKTFWLMSELHEDDSHELLDSALNKVGDGGWELVWISKADSGDSFGTFKRLRGGNQSDEASKA
jgi:hypothetical protein